MKRREFLINSAVASAVAPLLPELLVKGHSAEVAAGSGGASGLREYTGGGKRFRIVNGRNFTVTATPDGKLKLSYPAFKMSFNGNSRCRAWVMNSFMVPLAAGEVEALSTTGLALPEGSHTFYIYWINPDRATTIAQLRADWWEIMQNPQSYQNHTAQLEYVIVEMRKLVTAPTTEIKIPSDIQTAAWYPQFQETEHSINLPGGKIFGITKRVADIPPAKLNERGLFLQAVYADVNNNQIPYNRTWVTQRAYHKGKAELPFEQSIEPGATVAVLKQGLNCNPGDIISIHKGYSGKLPAGVRIDYSIPRSGEFQFSVTNTSATKVTPGGGVLYAGYFGTVDEEARKIYSHSSRRGHVTTSEICENGIPSDAVERIYKRLYELQMENDGVKRVSDTNIIADYFAALYGYGTDTSPYISYDNKRTLLSSAVHARKGVPGEPESAYYSNRAYEYRHRLVTGYLDGISRLLDGTRVYGHIHNLEKQYIAMPDRKVLTFGWVGFEGVQCEVERNATDQRLPLPGGDLIRTSRAMASFEQMKYESFFSLLVGDLYTVWDDNAQYGVDVRNFDLAHIGGAADWKNQWQPTGGEMVQYDASNPAHPKPAGSGWKWSDSAAPGHNGAFCGAYLFDQIQPFTNRSLSYARFSYSTEGTEKTGYFDGDEPVKGLLGTAEVSRFGKANPGQHNIVNQQEHRRPIVLLGRGTGGAVAIVMYPFAGLTETVTYKVTVQQTHIFQHTGSALGIYRLGTGPQRRRSTRPAA